MTRKALAPLAVAVALAVPATAAADFTWEGTWSSTFGDIVMTASGSGNYPGGTISGGIQGPNGESNSGTWQESSSKGKYLFTLSGSGRAFTGTYTRDPGDSCVFPPCDWNGTCIAGACLLNAPEPKSLFDGKPIKVRPKLGELTSYSAPPPGKTRQLRTPQLPAKTSAVTVDIATTSSTGGAHPAPPVAGVVLTRADQASNRNAERAMALCYLLALQGDLAAGTITFQGCADTVQKILNRHDEIQAKKTGPAGTTAQAGRCGVRRGKRLRAAARLKCKVTATGMRMTVRRRKGGPSLRSLFGRKSRLVVGRSRFDAGQSGDLTHVVWGKG